MPQMYMNHVERFRAVMNGRPVDRLANSKAINDPAHLKETVYMLGEYADDAYAAALRRYVQVLREHAPNVPLIWSSTTPVTRKDEVQRLDEQNNDQVIRRNAAAKQIMTEFHIPINDLYHVVLGKPDLRSPDGYHYHQQGYQVMGNAVAEMVLKILG